MGLLHDILFVYHTNHYKIHTLSILHFMHYHFRRFSHFQITLINVKCTCMSMMFTCRPRCSTAEPRVVTPDYPHLGAEDSGIATLSVDTASDYLLSVPPQLSASTVCSSTYRKCELKQYLCVRTVWLVVYVGFM